jgi:dissimilatory sulfite reductase (desulfoviridin) alpha/beta subunit
MKIGESVTVDKIKNGYWVGYRTGIITDVKSDKVRVRTRNNGNRWYSKNNVKSCIRYLLFGGQISIL